MLGQERGQRRARRGRHLTGHPNRAVRAVPTEILSIWAQSKQKGWSCTKGGATFIISAATTLPGLGLERPPHPIAVQVTQPKP